MNDGKPPGRLAAVFDFGRPQSREVLRQMVGAANVAQFDTPGKPLVVLVVDDLDGGIVRLAFEGEPQLIEFYRATLRTNVKLQPQRRVQFVLRDVAPALVEALRDAGKALALELQLPDGAA
jgi:hypothetical protein